MDSLLDEGQEKGSNVKALTQLDTDGSCPTIYLLTEYDNDSLYLTASDGKAVWSGTYHSAMLDSMSVKAHLSKEDFISQSLGALAQTTARGAFTFAYTTAVDKSGHLQFTWKKHIIEENVKFQLASVLLQNSSALTVSPMFEFAVGNTTHLSNEISDLKNTIASLREDRSQALKKLDECANLKENLESDLYGKFKLVLNDKKAKIRLLNEQAKFLAEDNQKLKERSSSSKVVGIQQQKNSKDSDATTDDETGTAANDRMDRTPSPVSKIPVEETVDMSSLLGGPSEEITSPPVKRRRRREAKKPTRQVTVSRPIGSRGDATAALTTKKSEPTRPSRSSSNASSQHSSSLEADELLDKM